MKTIRAQRDQRAMRRRGCRLRTLCLAAALMCGAGRAAWAQTPTEPEAARELTPEECVQMALEYSGRIRAADAEAAAAAARRREARAGLLPSVGGRASYTRIGGDIPDAEVALPGMESPVTLMSVERDRFHTEIGVDQPLFAGGRLTQSERSAARSAQSAERRAEQERVDVAFVVRRAYWTLREALAALEVTDAALVQMEEHARDVQLRFEAGTVLRSDLLAARTRRSEVALERVESENAVRVARLELNRLIGLPASTVVVPAEIPDPEPLPEEMDDLVSAGVAARPELQALAEEIEALRARASVVRGERLPELAFVGRVIYARPNPYVTAEQDEFRGTWEAGLSLSWSIWNGGAQGARETEAAELVRAAEARLAEARDEAAVDVARRYLEVQRAVEAVQVAGGNVEQAAEGLRVTRRQFAEGAALSSQVLEAERAYREAQVRLVRARSEYAVGRAALRHALGEIR